MTTKKLQVYDPPMCCSSGVCGTTVNPELARFAVDLEWLKKQGVEVERFNLSSHPAAFASSDTVKKALTERGNGCLPLTLVDGVIVKEGSYPTRAELSKSTGIEGCCCESDAPVKSADEESSSCGCGPSCDCGGTPCNGKTRFIVGGLILLLACGVIAYKVTAPKPAPKAAETTGFAVNASSKSNALNMPKTQTDVSTMKIEKPTTQTASAETAIAPKAVEEKAYLGFQLDSLSALNKIAISQDAAFILIPAEKDKTVNPEIAKAVSAAQETLKSKSVNVGIYTLATNAPDYSSIASQVSAPAILVACKGKGIGTVSGEVTETKLLQAYVASSQAGGCCGSSGGGSSGCK